MKTRQGIMKKPYTLFILLITAVALWTQSSQSFADPDSFYHAWITQEMVARGLVLDTFPALPFSGFSEHFTDHHFGYHLILIPFFLLFQDPFIALKVGTIVFIVAAFGILYSILRAERVPIPWFFALIPMVSGSFFFRLGLAKAAGGFSLIFFLYGLAALLKKKPGSLFTVSALYVLAYGGWFLLPIISGIYWVAASFGEMGYEKRTTSFRGFFSVLFSRTAMVLPAASCLGAIVGVVANPYFPENISFYIDQIVRIGLLNAKPTIVGSEWYGISFPALVEYNFVFVLLLCAAGTFFWFTFEKQDKKTIALGAIMIFLCIATFKSKRSIEYFIPVAVLWAGYVAKAARTISFRLPQEMTQKKVIAGIVLAISGILGIVVLGMQPAVYGLHAGIPFSSLQEEAVWLRDHTQKNEVIFNARWDSFPMLLFYYSKGQYFWGLDPRFVFYHDKARFYFAQALLKGTTQTALSDRICTTLHAQTIVIQNDQIETLTHNLDSADSGFRLAFQGKDARIYQKTKPCSAVE